MKKMLFHHDNTPAHTTAAAATKLDYELLSHPLYSPDLTTVKQKFESNEEVYLFHDYVNSDIQSSRFCICNIVEYEKATDAPL